MDLQILKGNYSTAETIALLEKFVAVKINFIEQKIGNDSSEEDIKMRERRIKELQNNFSTIKQNLLVKAGFCNLQSTIQVV
jgi:hypothetical protein